MSVLITGIGTVGPWGCGVEALSEALRTGHCALTPIERVQGIHASRSAQFAGVVDPASYKEWLPGAMSRRMSNSSRLAFAAARMAAKSAGLTDSDVGGERTAVSMGTSIGSSGFTIRFLEQVRERGPQGASPFLFMETVANSYAGQIALHFGARGSNSTLAQGPASGALAIARALHQLSSGSANRVIAGVVDEIGAVPHGLLDRFRALARPDENGVECGRVFDRSRSGFVVSEGATVLLLESEKLAHARGANVLGRVRCAIRAFDPSASAHDWGTGSQQLARALTEGLAKVGLGPSDIDRVVSTASGSRAGDRLEALVLRNAWGELELPPILAPKAVTGEYGGGQLASAVLALTDQEFAEPAGFENIDPELGVRPHDGSPLPAARRVLLSSLAAGGAACWIVLESCR